MSFLGFLNRFNLTKTLTDEEKTFRDKQGLVSSLDEFASSPQGGGAGSPLHEHLQPLRESTLKEQEIFKSIVLYRKQKNVLLELSKKLQVNLITQLDECKKLSRKASPQNKHRIKPIEYYIRKALYNNEKVMKDTQKELKKLKNKAA